MENTIKLIEEVQNMKKMYMNMALYGDDIPEEFMGMMTSFEKVMDLSCSVMYDQAKKLEEINNKLDQLLAK